jgi:RNA polymerase sigma factor (sigma-70 family)
MTATRSLSATLQHLRRILIADELAALPDAELVGRFAERRDEAAFTALVRRYSPVVLGVCRRVLRHEQDAEDAFQATFLVLARDAGSVRRAGAVGNWLYGVAHNVARKAKAARHRREVKEREAAARPRPEPRTGTTDDLREILDAELHALPDKYRTPIVLCDLRGLTAREAAAEVGCPAKTLGTRLSRGRSLLARRLARRGVALPAAALVAALPACAAAAVPPALIGSTVQAATGFAAGPAAAASPAVLALTEGVSNVMLLTTLKYAAVLACGVLVLAGLSHGPLRPVVQAAHASLAPASPTGKDAPVKSRARQFDFADHMHLLLDHLDQMLARVGLGRSESAVSTAAPADDKKDEKPALSGVWDRKDGELKIDFSEKDVVKIAPHGNDVIVIVCKYTVEKDGLVKATVTGFEGKEQAKQKLKEKLPVDTEFSFTWKAKDDAATLDDLKGEKVEIFKSLMEGEYGKKK